MGLGGLLRERSQVLSGILNGIDTSVWNPETDPRIAVRFSAQELQFRAASIARAMLSEFIMLASRKVPRGLTRLADNAVVQADVLGSALSRLCGAAYEGCTASGTRKLHAPFKN